MGDQSKMNQSAKDWCKVVVCATRWLGRVIHLIENRDKTVRIKLKYFQSRSYLLGLLGFRDWIGSVDIASNVKIHLWILNKVDWNRWINLVKLSQAGDWKLNLDENGFFASVQPLLWVDQVDQAANMNMQEMGRYNCFKQTAIPDGATIVVGRSSNCSQTVQPVLVIICQAALFWTTVSNRRPSSSLFK